MAIANVADPLRFAGVFNWGIMEYVHGLAVKKCLFLFCRVSKTDKDFWLLELVSARVGEVG